jgi:hypothetical protein
LPWDEIEKVELILVGKEILDRFLPPGAGKHYSVARL